MQFRIRLFQKNQVQYIQKAESTKSDNRMEIFKEMVQSFNNKLILVQNTCSKFESDKEVFHSIELLQVEWFKVFKMKGISEITSNFQHY